MADLSRTLPLRRDSVVAAHELIKSQIHETPTLTCRTLSDLASTPQSPEALVGTEFEGQTPAKPKIKLFFKCENYQKIGAFKFRGATHALARLTEEELAHGVVTHSSGNHAQALALAARMKGVRAHIVMPTISTPSKIAGTKGYGAEVIFSGSTSQEREAVVKEVIKNTGAVLVPPYDHPDIIFGQGTLGLELAAQVEELVKTSGELSVRGNNVGADHGAILDAVIAPCGGGGMLSGVALAFSECPTRVYGAEPSYQGADDGRRGLIAGKRIETVKTLTIADGLRTPLGEIPWKIITTKKGSSTLVEGMYSVTEDQIKAAMKLVIERMKVFVEPSAVVGLAVALYNEEFRRIVEKEGGKEGWNIGVVFSGGNTTLEAIGKLFNTIEQKGERETGIVGRTGERSAENIAG